MRKNIERIKEVCAWHPPPVPPSRRSTRAGDVPQNPCSGWLVQERASWLVDHARLCVCACVCVWGGGGLCWVQARAAVGVDFPLMIDCYMSLTVPYVVELARRVRAFVAVGPSSIHSLPFFPAHTTSVLLFPARIRSHVHCAHT
jgi:hypothetical protein